MKTSLPVFVLGLLVNAALVYAGTGAATITLSNTPAAVNCGASSYVNTVIVSVIPGGEGKVYVGQSSQNVSTGAGIAQILFPNGGGHSEQFELSDPSGNDTINLCNLYVAGEIAGEIALASWNTRTGPPLEMKWCWRRRRLIWVRFRANAPSGCAGETGPFVPFGPAGLLQDSSLTDTDPSYYFSKIRVQVIPGQEGKIHLAWCNGVTDGLFSCFISQYRDALAAQRMVGGLGFAGPRRAKRALHVRWRAQLASLSTAGALCPTSARRDCRWRCGNCNRTAAWWIRPASIRSPEPMAFLRPHGARLHRDCVFG